jgi:glucose/arabinose dehydrogenase
MRRRCLAGIFSVLLCASILDAARKLPLDLVQLPPGFRISIFAEQVPNARQLAVARDGTVFVGTAQVGSVYALPDQDHDGKADRVIIVARGLRAPNGVAFSNGALYVAEISRIWRYDSILSTLKRPRSPTLVTKDLPSDEAHGLKYIKFGPDGWLYMGVGAPCNVCEKRAPYASIVRMKPDGSGQEVYARGIRNSVGFDWSPDSQELWFTDNGRDLLGDDIPPDELNRATRQGLNFGFPYCHGKDIRDPEFGARYPCSQFVPPVLGFPAHVASLGMRFYTGKMFPPEYRGGIFVAEHGSWNRSRKIGYRVSFVKVSGDRALSETVFAQGWLQGERAWGRPADVLVLPDGSLLVSDDQAGVIYRITYGK